MDGIDDYVARGRRIAGVAGVRDICTAERILKVPTSPLVIESAAGCRLV